ncbi:MAG: magnetochrome domain-containing protein [Magnetococcales bacterium]|nr:magnetochrome domain-containing protein [Magnetococcales bacterium]MBF0439032.1 magnetochrome domain-containing protein [Magnetococcales bacterium]
MDPKKKQKPDYLKRFGWPVLITMALTAGYLFHEPLMKWLHPLAGVLDFVGADRLSRRLEGEVLGSMPKPTQPTITGTVKDLVVEQKTRKMVVRRIPQIVPGQARPHGDWGPCIRCHLFKGGPPPGSQSITPVGKVWEKLSTYHKVGPPILPNSTIPHPPSGRCIKCHDIVIQMPI